MPDGLTWRSQPTVSACATHDYADFAQEFLRRNARYRQDHALSEQRVAARPEVAQDEQEGLARRWGLSFPLRSGRFARRRTSVLATP